MPCDSGPRDYAYEGYCQRIGWFNWIAEQVGSEERLDVERFVEQCGYYGEAERQSVVRLCKLISALPLDKREAIIYNARDRTARALADWWEYHQEEDRKRDAERREREENERLRAEAAKKLTPEERRAVGLKP